MMNKSLSNAVCESSFTQKPSLNKHIQAVHERKKPFKCNICDSRITQTAIEDTYSISS